jgi:hypothetical protein
MVFIVFKKKLGQWIAPLVICYRFLGTVRFLNISLAFFFQYFANFLIELSVNTLLVLRQQYFLSLSSHFSNCEYNQLVNISISLYSCLSEVTLEQGVLHCFSFNNALRMNFFEIVSNSRFSHWEHFKKIFLSIFKGQSKVSRGNIFIKGWLHMLHLGNLEILRQNHLLSVLKFVPMQVEKHKYALLHFNQNVILMCECSEFNLFNNEIIFV